MNSNYNSELRILVVRHNALGELVMSIPFLFHLRRIFKHCHITLLSTPYAEALFKYSYYYDELIVLPPYKIKRDYSTIIPVLKKKTFDMFFCPMDSPEAARIGIELDIPSRIGFYNTITDGFTHPIYVPDNLYKPKKLLHLLFPFDKEIVEEIPVLKIETSNKDKTKAKSFLGERENKTKPLVGLNIGGSMPYKTWPYDNFKIIGLYIIKELNADIVIFAGKNEDEDSVYELARCIDHTALVAYNLPLLEVVEILGNCSVVITNDSGLSWLTAAAATPSIVLFRPSSSMDVYKPIGDQHIGIQAWFDQNDWTTSGIKAISTNQVLYELTELWRIIGSK